MIKRASVLCILLAVAVWVFPFVGAGPSSAGPVLFGKVHRQFHPTRGKIFVLVIGSDAREGNPDNVRADAVHLVGFNSKTMRGGILNFPRDSWVSIPGSGSGRINEALTRGGPELLARTVESMTGIRIDYWVMTGFEGFQSIIRKIEGVRMHIPRDIYDPGGSGAHLQAGTQKLGAINALAYVRTRKAFSNGDIARTTNQAKFLVALLRKFRSDIGENPASLMRWMSIAKHHARLDIPADEMFRLGILASQASPKKVDFVTVPVSLGTVGSASVVFISPAAHDLYARFKKTASL